MPANASFCYTAAGPEGEAPNGSSSVSFDQRRLRKDGVKREKAQRSNSALTNLVSVGWENSEKYSISILMGLLVCRCRFFVQFELDPSSRLSVRSRD